MEWVERYLGIPYLERGRTLDGCDCWGLVRLVLKERFGIELPSLDGSYDHVDPELSARLINQTAPAVDARLVDTPCAGDVAVMRVRAATAHVGVFVSETHVLHTVRGRGPALETVKSLGNRIVEVRRVR